MISSITSECLTNVTIMVKVAMVTYIHCENFANQAKHGYIVSKFYNRSMKSFLQNNNIKKCVY